MITEPTWNEKANDGAGAWEFPDAWPAPARAAWLEARAALDADEKRADELEASRAAAAKGPEAALLELRLKQDEARRRAGEAERGAADDRAWLEAQAKYGAGRVARVYVEDRWLILRANTTQEWDAVQARAERLTAAALEAGDAERAQNDAREAYRLGVLEKSLVHPDKATARAALDRLPGAWHAAYTTRDALNRGPIEAAGKGGAR